MDLEVWKFSQHSLDVSTLFSDPQWERMAIQAIEKDSQGILVENKSLAKIPFFFKKKRKKKA